MDPRKTIFPSALEQYHCRRERSVSFATQTEVISFSPPSKTDLELMIISAYFFLLSFGCQSPSSLRPEGGSPSSEASSARQGRIEEWLPFVMMMMIQAVENNTKEIPEKKSFFLLLGEPGSHNGFERKEVA